MKAKGVVRMDASLGRQNSFAFGRVSQQLDAAVHLSVVQATDLVHKAAVANINKRTGETAKKVYKLVRRSGRGEPQGHVGARDKIARILEFGSRAHIIRPTEAHQARARSEFLMGRRRTDKAYLKFRMGGRIVYATQVRHPGTRPYYWLKRAFDSTGPGTVAIFDRNIRRAVDG